MQIKEDRSKGLIHLYPVDKDELGEDIQFLQALFELKPRTLFEFDSIGPVVYHGPNKSRVAMIFIRKRLFGWQVQKYRLLATDSRDENVRNYLLDQLVSNRSEKNSRRGIYVYETGVIEGDYRHHLNGPYASICLGFCNWCNSPLIDRLEVKEKACEKCLRLSWQEKLEIQRRQKKRLLRIISS